MTKKIIEKVLKGGTFDTKDLTPDEKKALFAKMAKEGSSESTAYVRFFSKGFDQWEIEGITNTVEQFLLGATTEEGKDKGYPFVLFMQEGKDLGKLWEIIIGQRLGNVMIDFMAERGMRSQVTVRNRFKANDWKPWELKGIKKVMEEFANDGETR